MGVLEVHVFSDSFKVMAILLNEQKINWGLKICNTGEKAVSSGVIEVAVTAQGTTSVAAVLKRFVTGCDAPSMMLTTKSGKPKSVSQFSETELKAILSSVDWLAAIQTCS